MFLVRERESKCYLGIFAATEIADLWDMVDEHDDPVDYEWAEIELGGFIFGHPRPLLNDISDDEVDPTTEWDAPFTSAKLTTNELMDRKLYSGDLQWTRFDFADVGDGLIARINERLQREEEAQSGASNDNPARR
jgi:hypothetical protein